jgi:SPP1 family predicted phage head-tail adaptor
MIGQMRDRVLIKSQVDTPVPGAGAESRYVPFITCWTKISPLSSSRVLQDSQINLNDGFSFSIRYSSAQVIDKTMLVEYMGKDYTIGSIKIVNNRFRFYEINAVTNDQPVQPIIT